MRNEFITDVYDTLHGDMRPGCRVRRVENAFAEGKTCDQLYTQVREAYERICKRLQSGEADEDLETIVRSMWGDCDELCFRMYEYGARFGMRE